MEGSLMKYNSETKSSPKVSRVKLPNTQIAPEICHLKGIVNHDKGALRETSMQNQTMHLTLFKNNVQKHLPRTAHKYAQPCQLTYLQCLRSSSQEGSSKALFLFFSIFSKAINLLR